MLRQFSQGIHIFLNISDNFKPVMPLLLGGCLFFFTFWSISYLLGFACYSYDNNIRKLLFLLLKWNNWINHTSSGKDEGALSQMGSVPGDFSVGFLWVMFNWIKLINGDMSRSKNKWFRYVTCLYKIEMQRKYFQKLVSSEDMLSKTDESRIVCHFFWGLHPCMFGLCDDSLKLSGLTVFY